MLATDVHQSCHPLFVESSQQSLSRSANAKESDISLEEVRENSDCSGFIEIIGMQSICPQRSQHEVQRLPCLQAIRDTSSMCFVHWDQLTLCMPKHQTVPRLVAIQIPNTPCPSSPISHPLIGQVMEFLAMDLNSYLSIAPGTEAHCPRAQPNAEQWLGGTATNSCRWAHVGNAQCPCHPWCLIFVDIYYRHWYIFYIKMHGLYYLGPCGLNGWLGMKPLHVVNEGYVAVSW